MPLLSALLAQYPQAMLLTRAPAADITLPIWPVQGTLAVFLARLEVSFVAAAIAEGFRPTALHFAEAEFPLVVFIQICKVVLAESLKLSILEVTLIVRAILPLKSASALFLSLKKLPSISRTRSAGPAPSLYAFPML